jgi:nitroimidazol reductase NimA-like FMN-containing flavoprotein (pyridoxamine 5'-phosphate oxidase superfamily)
LPVHTLPPITEDEINRFLDGKLNLQLASIDEKGDPNIQPVWFNYEKNLQKIFIITPKKS